MNKIYNIQQAAKFLNYHVKTLQRLDREGKLPARRTKTNRRFYLEKDLLDFLGLEESDGRKKD